MSTIKDQAVAYEAPQTKNVTDLKEVSVDTEITEETFTKGDGEQFTLSLIEVDGVKYRVPASVIISLKAVLEAKPDMKTFKVTKSGEGMSTKYTVIPLN